MDISSLSITDARDLADRINLLTSKAEDLQEVFGAAPVIDITGDLRICAPLLPAMDVLPALAAAREAWQAEKDRDMSEMTLRSARETEALIREQGPAPSDAGQGALPRGAAVATPDGPIIPDGVPAMPPVPADAPAPVKRTRMTPRAVGWSDADDTVAVNVAVRLDGETWNEIYRVAAKETGRTFEGVKARIKSHLMTRIFDARDAARSAAAAAEAKADQPHPPADQIAPAAAKPAPLRDDLIGDDEAGKIMRLHDQGESFNVIGAHLNRHPSAVASLIKRTMAERAAADVASILAEAPTITAAVDASTYAATRAVSVADIVDAAPVVPLSKVITAQTPEQMGKTTVAMQPPYALTAPAKETNRPSVEGLTSAPHRQLRGYLNSLGYKEPWSAALDLDLVQGLHEGRRLAEIAADLGVDTDACKKRFALLSAHARNDKGGLTIDGQSLLLAELKVRHTLIAGGAA